MFQYVVYRPILYLLSIGSLGGAVANARACRAYDRGFNLRRKPVIELRFGQMKHQGSV